MRMTRRYRAGGAKLVVFRLVVFRLVVFRLVVFRLVVFRLGVRAARRFNT
jgi:hypothetical protein